MSHDEDNIDWHGDSDQLNIDMKSRTPYSDAVKCKKLVTHVKRPMNPFMIWSQVERRKLMEKYPGIHSLNVSIELGKRWKMLSDKERIPFAKEAERLRKLHSEEFPDYKFSPKPRKKKKTPVDLKNKVILQNKVGSTPGNSKRKDENFIARNNLMDMKKRKTQVSETVTKSSSKLASKPSSSKNTGKIEHNQKDKCPSFESEQAPVSLKKTLRKDKFSKITTEGKPIWDSLMEVDIATLSSKKDLPPRLQIDDCLTSGSIAALSCYRDDWADAFDYLTDKVLQSSKNIYEEIDNISKQYGEALEGKNNTYLTEPLELNIPDINKELGKKWKDPNFGLRFSS